MDSLSQLGLALGDIHGMAACNPTVLLELPDTCLLAVMQCCADDPLSLCSAARAHSRLHQAVVLTLSSITAVVDQQKADSAMVYLAKYGPRIDSIDLQHTESDSNSAVTLHQLPENLHKLSSLALKGLHLQLHQGNGCRGVLGAGPPLKQLRLDSCVVLDGAEDPSAKLKEALKLLPDLLDLSINDLLYMHGPYYNKHLRFSCSTVPELQQLTHLELSCFGSMHTPEHPNLQHLQHLQELRLGPNGRGCHPADLLSGLQHLTRVEILGGGGTFGLKPDILSGQTQIQHLALRNVRVDGAGEGVHQLLAHLQQMQQLTCLDFRARPYSRFYTLQASAPVEAYSALTASSKLQYLDISGCKLPAGMWEHMFPNGRQLPHLQVLSLGCVEHGSAGNRAPAPDGSRIVNCCPGLQTLDIESLQYSSDMLAPLTGLSSLQQLTLSPHGVSGEGLEVVGQLTGLRQLELTGGPKTDDGEAQELLLQLTQLRQLTKLTYKYYNGTAIAAFGTHKAHQFCCEAACHEPVWAQLLRLQSNCSESDVAQQLVTALAE